MCVSLIFSFIFVNWIHCCGFFFVLDFHLQLLFHGLHKPCYWFRVVQFKFINNYNYTLVSFGLRGTTGFGLGGTVGFCGSLEKNFFNKLTAPIIIFKLYICPRWILGRF